VLVCKFAQKTTSSERAGNAKVQLCSAPNQLRR
jgi:hypothetical protein